MRRVIDNLNYNFDESITLILGFCTIAFLVLGFACCAILDEFNPKLPLAGFWFLSLGAVTSSIGMLRS